MLWSINLLLVYLCAQIHSMWEEYLSGMYDYLGTEKCGVNYKDWSLNHNKTSTVGQFLSAHEGLTFSGKYLFIHLPLNTYTLGISFTAAVLCMRKSFSICILICRCL